MEKKDNKDKIEMAMSLLKEVIDLPLYSRRTETQQHPPAFTSTSLWSSPTGSGSASRTSVGLTNLPSRPMPNRAVENFRTTFPSMSARGINHQTLRQTVPKSTNNFMPGRYKVKERFANHQEICKKLEEEFLPLKSCGGYTLLRSIGGGVGRPLEKLPINWFNIKNIRSCFSRQACIYICPIQKNLDMSEKIIAANPDAGPDLKCIGCIGLLMGAQLLEEHIKHCQASNDFRANHENTPSTSIKVSNRKRTWSKTLPGFSHTALPALSGGRNEIQDPECEICKQLLHDGTQLGKPDSCACFFHNICLRQWKDTVPPEKSINCPMCKKPFTIVVLCDLCDLERSSQPEELLEDEDRDVFGDQETANHVKIQESNESVQKSSSIHDILKQQQKKEVKYTESGEESFMIIHVRRGHVLEDGLSELLDMEPHEWRSSLRVVFVGESGVDTGGLSREFFTLFNSALAESGLVCGKSSMLALSHNQALLESGKYEALGSVLGLALLGGFHVPQFFSKSFVNVILQRKDADDAESSIVSSCLEEVQAFLKGLSRHDVLSLLREHPEEAYQLFNTPTLQLQEMLDFFKPEWSPEGSSKRVKEDEVYYYWVKFLKECSRGRVTCRATKIEDLGSNTSSPGNDPPISTLSLEGVMQFITGCPQKPISIPFGRITFEHDNADMSSRRHVFANTCAMQLTIPINAIYTGSYKQFIQQFTEDIFSGQDFGQV
eukprot:gene1751-1950_t